MQADVAVIDDFSKKLIKTGTILLSSKPVKFSFTPIRGTVYRVTISTQGKYAIQRAFEVAVAGPIPQPEAAWDETAKYLKKKLVCRIRPADYNCPQLRTAQGGQAKVVKTNFGTYWESAPSKNRTEAAWISARFEMRHPEYPHMVEIDYPDDSNRNMGFSVGRSVGAFARMLKIANGGAVTGTPYPNSFKMRTWQSIFFPEPEIRLGNRSGCVSDQRMACCDF